MEYIVIKRFKTKAICGNINLPYGTKCECINNILTYKGMQLCFNTSQNAYDYFALNTDGCGLERGKLINSIITTLKKPDKYHQLRWNKIWEDTFCKKYKREESENFWLWNHAFFNAPIKDLLYIAKLIGINFKKGDK